MISKKILISTFIILSLFYSIFLHAEILDGGEIRFHGVVTDESPKWTWQISSTDQRWSVDIANAKREGEKLIFNLKNKGVLPFLEGHLYEVAERGGPGLTPSITFSSEGQTFMLNEGESTTAQRFRASVPVRDPESGDTVGSLSFTLEQGMGLTLGKQKENVFIPKGLSLVSGDTVTQVQPNTLSSQLLNRLSNLMMLNRNFGGEMTATSNGQTVSQSILSDGRVMNLAAAYASILSDFQLQLPATGTPARWHVGINVTVTVQ